MTNDLNSMIVDEAYKKRLSGFIDSNQLSKELDDLLKYYDAENVKPDLEKTKRILSKFDLNEELVKMREEY